MLHHRLTTDLENCTFCPKLCRFACPVSEATGNEAYTPRHKMLAWRMAHKALLPIDAELARLAYACTGCYACREYCELGNDVPLALAVARERVREQCCEPPAVAALADTYDRTGTPYAEDLSARLAGLVDDPGPHSAPVVYFPSCHALDAGTPLAPTLALVRSLAGHPVRVDTGPVRCCGRQLLHLGRVDLLLPHARRVAQQLDGAALIVTDDPGCADALGTVYRQLGVALSGPVVHLAEFLSLHAGDLARRLDPRRRLANAVLHEPCFLVRRLDGRTALQRMFEAAAVPAGRLPVGVGRDTLCCGGSLHARIDPALSELMAAQRFADLQATGAEAIVTACPTCVQRLSGRGLPVVDLAAHVASMAGLAPSA